MQMAHPRGSFWSTPFLGCSLPLIIPLTTMVATTSTTTSPSRQTIFVQVSAPLDKPVETKPTWPPGFVEIAQSLRESHAPWIMINLPQEETFTPSLLVGAATTTRMSTQLWQDATMGTTYINSDNLCEFDQLGPSFPGGWPPYGHSRGCHQHKELRVAVATFAQFYQP